MFEEPEGFDSAASSVGYWAHHFSSLRLEHGGTHLCIIHPAVLVSGLNALMFCSSISIDTGKSHWEKPKFKQCKLLQALPNKIVDLANITVSDEFRFMHILPGIALLHTVVSSHDEELEIEIILRIIECAGHKMEFPGRTANLMVARLALAVLRVDHTFEGVAFSIRSYEESTEPETKNITKALTTYVVSASISDISIQNLADPVVITLQHIQGNQNYDQVRCAFWDFGNNNGSTWCGPSVRQKQERLRETFVHNLLTSSVKSTTAGSIVKSLGSAQGTPRETSSPNDYFDEDPNCFSSLSCEAVSNSVRRI
ncbi:hypothetical protein JEQ12_020345 [Ovis aries]|uniref:GAIN-B domain-containing protein n=1 Tax=Ovis aries TaxID=9940 RepID=A0A835ZMK7_SHEEP|nr:hypothetical protein JEQ12_020345 [Ovis aries]